MGGGALSALAAEIEAAAKAGNLDAVNARMTDLEAQFAQLREAMANCV
jgi:hypothetical protein